MTTDLDAQRGVCMMLRFAFILMVFCVWPLASHGQDVGVFSDPDCTTITNPRVGQAFCFDETAKKLKAWNGSRWLTPPPLEIVNLRDFGAKGDGVTDDASAFNTAVSASCSQGGTWIVVPEPSLAYSIRSTVRITCGGNIGF